MSNAECEVYNVGFKIASLYKTGYLCQVNLVIDVYLIASIMPFNLWASK